MAELKMCLCSCGYEFQYKIGTGFRFPEVYQTVLKKAKNGELGEEIKAFLANHPEGAIDAHYVLKRCLKCGELENTLSLDMYLPKDGYVHYKDPNRIWSLCAPYKGVDYVSTRELYDHYYLFEKYQHECPACNGEMETIDNEYGEMRRFQKFWETKEDQPLERIELPCPNCGKLISASFIGNWD